MPDHTPRRTTAYSNAASAAHLRPAAPPACPRHQLHPLQRLPRAPRPRARAEPPRIWPLRARASALWRRPRRTWSRCRSPAQHARLRARASCPQSRSRTPPAEPRPRLPLGARSPSPSRAAPLPPEPPHHEPASLQHHATRIHTGPPPCARPFWVEEGERSRGKSPGQRRRRPRKKEAPGRR
jgi:hypothetical protein